MSVVCPAVFTVSTTGLMPETWMVSASSPIFIDDVDSARKTDSEVDVCANRGLEPGELERDDIRAGRQFEEAIVTVDSADRGHLRYLECGTLHRNRDARHGGARFVGDLAHEAGRLRRLPPNSAGSQPYQQQGEPRREHHRANATHICSPCQNQFSLSPTQRTAPAEVVAAGVSLMG